MRQDFNLFFPELQREGNSSRVFFYDILCQNGESERTGGTMKEGFALCVYSYVVFGVLKSRIEQELKTSVPEIKKRGESQKVFMSNFEPVRGLIDIQQLEF